MTQKSIHIGVRALLLVPLWLSGCLHDDKTKSEASATTPPQFSLSVGITGSGSVASAPAGITCGSDCDEMLDAGTPVTLTATPDSGFQFAAWGGDCTGSGGCEVTMDAAKRVTAEFLAASTPAPDPGASLTAGYNATTRSVTAATVVLDLALPASGNYPVWVSGTGYPNFVRAATHDVLPGGYFNRGFSRFSPGHFTDGGRGEHYSGIGQITGFNTVGSDSSRMVVGQLIRFGTTFFTDQVSAYAGNGDIKEIILINDTGERPMILTKGGGTRVLGACDGTTCNTTGSVTDIDYHNDGNHQPDINTYLGQWLWVEFAFNSNVPFTRTRIWSADGTLQGAEIIAPWASPGSVTTLDVIGFVNSIPVPGAQPYYDLERVEFRIGTYTDITPPVGFPGSAR